MDEDVWLPLRMMRPVDIRQFKEPGIVLPVQPRDPTIAITIWEDSVFGMLLDGPHSFTFFKVEAQSRFLGLFIPTPEIVVSVSSASKGEAVWQQRGALILEDGRANVVGNRAGDQWSDPVNVPLWQDIDFQGAEGKTVGFNRWHLRVTDEHEHRVIWRSPEQALS